MMSDSITPKPEDIDSAIIEPDSQAWLGGDFLNAQAKAKWHEAIRPPEDGKSELKETDITVESRRKPYKKLPRSDWAIGQVLARNAGLIGPASRALGVARETLYARIQKSPTLQQARETAIETVKDMAEGNVYRGIQAGDQRDTHFFLRTMGKDRGYTTSSEVTGPEGGEIRIVLSPREEKL